MSQQTINRGSLEWMDSSLRVVGSIYSNYDIPKKELKGNHLRFAGRVYLLTGGQTFSSATNFASCFKCMAWARLLGVKREVLLFVMAIYINLPYPIPKYQEVFRIKKITMLAQWTTDVGLCLISRLRIGLRENLMVLLIVCLSIQ